MAQRVGVGIVQHRCQAVTQVTVLTQVIDNQRVDQAGLTAALFLGSAQQHGFGLGTQTH
jgi:hypothetical protein